MNYLLILIYSGMMMVSEPRANLDECLTEAKGRIGQEAKVQFWDNMNGSNPKPKVVLAFCVQGADSSESR